MARHSSVDVLGWLAASLSVAAFAFLWVPVRGLSPMTHGEASALLHAQTGWSVLVRGHSATGSHDLLYWLLASPIAARPDALELLRCVSLLAGALVVASAARTAAVLWGGAAALVSGGLLVVQPLVVPLSTTAGPQALALAALALAGWRLASRLQSYEELGAGTAILYALLLVLAVGLDIDLAPALVAHLVFAASKRPSARGWVQLVVGWSLAAGATAWGWLTGGVTSGVTAGAQSPAAVGNALRQAVAGPTPLFWLVPVGCLVVLLVSALGSRGRSLADAGLGMALGLVIATPLAVVVCGSRRHGALDATTMTSIVLGMALLAGCAAGQWRGQTRQRLVAAVLVAGLAFAGWYGRGPVSPSWYNADGNPPLARDLALGAETGEVVVVDDLAAPGLSGALAAQLGDTGLWRQAREGLTSSRPTVFLVSSVAPWATRAAQLDDVHGRLVWVGPGSVPADVPQRCTLAGTDRHASMTTSRFDCR